jgi:hypothetical protein
MIHIINPSQRVNINASFLFLPRKNLEIADEVQEHRVQSFVRKVRSHTHASAVPEAVVLVRVADSQRWGSKANGSSNVPSSVLDVSSVLNLLDLVL